MMNDESVSVSASVSVSVCACVRVCVRVCVYVPTPIILFEGIVMIIAPIAAAAAAASQMNREYVRKTILEKSYPTH